MAGQPWHAWTVSETLRYWECDPRQGLSSTEVDRRRRLFGPNALAGDDQPPAWRRLASQFKDVMVLILLAATFIAFTLGELVDAVTIALIVVINGCMGFLYEYRAERALNALQAMVAPSSRVLRGGGVMEVATDTLVPGDLLLLEAGDRVPADARLTESESLELDESPLTGESLPVRKRAGSACAEDAPVGDRENMAFSGTTVSRGRARAVVVATGMHTEMGRIAGLIKGVQAEQTPLQRRLAELASLLLVGCLVICGLVVAVGLLNGESLYIMLLAGVSLAVAAIPEGLPAVVTIVLALGVQRMVRVQAVIRRLPAVETLGCTTVICSDKTGTLTLGRMQVRGIWVGGRRHPPGDRKDLAVHRLLTLGGVICNNAEAGDGEEVRGSPTDTALYIGARDAGVAPDHLRRQYRRLGEIPFDSARKCMTVVVEGPEGTAACTKGAPEVVLGFCRRWWDGARVRPLTPAERRRIDAAAARMAGEALRVLAVAHRPLVPGRAGREIEPERDMILVGLVGLADPPRPEVSRALARCRQAGIRVQMITGDHRATAVAVARELGLVGHRPRVIEGTELNRLSDRQLAARVEHTQVFARVSPEHKLRIVRALKGRGHVVAMTGDGVNDAPAVKEAHIGVAMGRTGTAVTQEAASMVLLDDNFSTIVNAVEQGRAIYDNIRKFVRYLLASNLGEVLVMFLGTLAGLPLPLLPIQILFVNLVTDGLPAVALGLEPPEGDVMQRPPRSPQESVFSRGLGVRILVWGHVIGLVALAIFIWSLWHTGSTEHARTAALASLVISQMFHVLDCRSERQSLLDMVWWSNLPLLLAIGSTLVLLMAVVYLPFLQVPFRTVALAPLDWAVITAASGIWSALVALGRRTGAQGQAVAVPGSIK